MLTLFMGLLLGAGAAEAQTTPAPPTVCKLSSGSDESITFACTCARQDSTRSPALFNWEIDWDETDKRARADYRCHDYPNTAATVAGLPGAGSVMTYVRWRGGLAPDVSRWNWGWSPDWYELVSAEEMDHLTDPGDAKPGGWIIDPLDPTVVQVRESDADPGSEPMVMLNPGSEVIQDILIGDLNGDDQDDVLMTFQSGAQHEAMGPFGGASETLILGD